MSNPFKWLCWFVLSFFFIGNTSFADDTTQSPQTSAPPQKVDCDYKLEANQVPDDTTLEEWGTYAAIQSFTFKSDDLDASLDTLKTCYTSKGWKAFNEALSTSGNLEAIKTNGLTVSSKLSGKVSVTNIKDNQWKVSVPLEVLYQNQEKQLQQLLKVDLLIMKEKSDQLGIIQVIAVPFDKKTKDEKPPKA